MEVQKVLNICRDKTECVNKESHKLSKAKTIKLTKTAEYIQTLRQFLHKLRE